MSVLFNEHSDDLLEKKVSLSTEEDKFDFNSVYSDNLPQLLKGLNISLIASSYQAQRVFLMRSDGDKIDVNFKSFKRPMGITVHNDNITIGTHDKVIKFIRNDKVAKYLDNVNIDSSFVPSAMHVTGMINIHDIDYGNDGLYVVNSAFSCICKIVPDYSFEVYWKPEFISELVPEDRCHLNGMALKDGKPKYVTMFNQLDYRGSWKVNKAPTGVLMDIENNEVLVDNLFMPHSPRYKNGKIYFCDSCYGEVCFYDLATSKKETIAKFKGFTRGIDFYGPLMFVGTSKVRQKNEEDIIPLIGDGVDSTICSIYVINLETNQVIGNMEFSGDVEQIYDVSIIKNSSYPELLEPEHEKIKNIYNFKEI